MRRKVLVAAYACEPDGGSEPGVGWHMCQAISQENEAWVITRKNNREKIEKALAKNPNPYLHFAYADLPSWARFWKKGGRFTRTYYYLWQFAALREALKLHRSVKFDLAHHVTFVNNWMFTFLALLPIPFIWGPIGAHGEMPAGLVPNRWVLVKDRLRGYFLAVFRIMDPLYWLSAIRAWRVIGIDQASCQHFPLSLFVSHKFINHTAIGVENIFPTGRKGEQAGQLFRVLSMGRLVPLKGFHLTVRAFAQFLGSFPDSELVIVGKGANESIREFARELDIESKVVFIDWLPRQDALAEMTKADVFLFPTFEGGGMVVLEAMAHGLPIVCLNIGGPASMVTHDCGALVEPGELEGTVEKLAEGLKMLARDKSLRDGMGVTAKQRIQNHFLWSRRHEAIRQWYDKHD